MTQENRMGAEPAVLPVRLSLTASNVDGTTVLTLAGEIDHDTGDLLQQAMNSASATSHHVVVDLSKVSFIDSSGINIFLATHHTLTASGGRLRLAAPTGAVLRTLRLVGVDAVIGCHTTLDLALQ